MANSSISWIEWQKKIIREEYKDIIPARDNVQKQFDKTVKDTLHLVKRND
jgi:hypothetical protein